MIGRARGERGFVLSVVIFAVAALSIAGTALFLVVHSENAMANTGAESSRALHLANAGLSRYMGETFGQPRDSVRYEMAGGVVTVTSTLIIPGDTSELYVIRSEAEIADRRVRDLVSRRVVQQYARLRQRPFMPAAGFVMGSTNAKVRNSVIDGRDQCVAGPLPDVAGITTVGNGDVRGTIDGSPATRSQTYAEMMQEIGLDWAALNDAAFPFDYEVPGATWPPFLLGRVPANEYPTIRVRGDLRAHPWLSGRGLLVVTGELTFQDGFTWDGVILAGRVSSNLNNRFTVNGALLTGFAGPMDRVDIHQATIRYDSCKVLNASENIAMFSPIPNTWWESSEEL